MKISIVAAIAAVALPLAAQAQAQSLPQKKTDLEEAMRVQQFICSGIADVTARGSNDYRSADLVRCQMTLEQQRADYQRFMATYTAPQPTATKVATKSHGARDQVADAAYTGR